ncbi:hypothetical protein SAMN03159341_12271 [Paenibacillus sp. 1_12]|nr:hypothetical protein SAMN03159341_12271 [Paenibacillus sp. 1_12]
MFMLFFLLVLFTFIALLIGLIKPKTIIFWGASEKKTRKRILLYCGLALIVFFIAFVATAPELSAEERAAMAIQREVEQTKKDAEKKVKAEEKAKKDAEDKDKKDAVEKTKVEEKAKKEVDEKAKREAAEMTKTEVAAKKEADAKAKVEDEKAKKEAAEKAKAEEVAKKEADAKALAEEKAKLEAEAKAKAEADAKAKVEQLAQEEAERKAKAAEQVRLDEEQFKSSVQKVGYKEMARNPDDYKTKKVVFTGQVVQTLESGNNVELRINVTQNQFGWEDTIYVNFTKKAGESRILEDDVIRLWGTVKGLKTYKSVMGGQITIPEVDAKYISLIK